MPPRLACAVLLAPLPDWLRTFGIPTTDLTDYPLGFYLPSNRESLVVSILSAGTFFGALLGAPVADIIGRRFGIVLSIGASLHLLALL